MLCYDMLFIKHDMMCVKLNVMICYVMLYVMLIIFIFILCYDILYLYLCC